MHSPLRVPLSSVAPAPDQLSPALAEPSRPTWIIPSAIATAMAVLVIVVGFWRVASTRPACSDLAQPMQQTRDFLARGNPSLAVGVAESTLDQASPTACPAARLALATLWYRASLDDVLARPTADQATTRQAALRWLAIEQRAESYGIARADHVAPIEIARRAYAARAWPLADVALRRAWDDGTADVEAASLRYAVLRNQAGDLAYRATPPDREQAVRLLATAQAIAAAYHLPNAEACQDLEQLGILDCTQPTPDPADPALTARAR